MIIHAKKQPQETLENYSGGSGRITFTTLLPDEALFKEEARFFKVMSFAPNASIGEHAHCGNIALYIVLAGHGIALDNGIAKDIAAGDVLYTSDGGTHGICDAGSGDLVVLAAVLLENRAK